MDIDGTPLGVMALFSRNRIMAEEDLLLEGIAHVTSQALHSAQADAALRQSEEHFRQLAEQSSDAIWFVSVDPEHILYVNPVMEKVWGLPAERFYQDASAWTKAIHSEDQRRFHKAWEACLQGRSPRFEAEYRIVQPDGFHGVSAGLWHRPRRRLRQAG
jgi:PAS domain S-box-containing protein